MTEEAQRLLILLVLLLALALIVGYGLRVMVK